MSRGGWGGRAAVVLAGVVAALALGAGPAAAHDELTGTDPADGSTVDTAPDRVVLTFTEPALELGTEVLVTGPDGATVSEGAAVLEGSTVSQALAAARPAGAYRVDWRVTSEDGHPVSGTLTFTATNAVPAPSPSDAPTSDDATTPAEATTPADETTTPAAETTTPADDTPTPADGGVTTAAEPDDEATSPAEIGEAGPSPDASTATGGGHPGLTAGVVVAAVILVLVAATLGRRASLRHKARAAGTPPAAPPSAEG